ncbi:MAG: NAD-dependent epimerase/dehydratase family protein [Gaiella sp.]
MTWLVTGGSGFLGLHLLRRLSERGIAVRSLDVTPLDVALPGVEAITGDVREARVLEKALEGVDVVVHAAAALPSGRDLEGVNATGTATLARLARSARVQRSVLVSSAVVYGLRPSPVAESVEPRPVDAYGRSKLAAERAWLASAPSPLVLRPSAFVGPERLGAFGMLFRWLREGRRIYVLGRGDNRYQLLDVCDLVTAIELAAERPGGGVLNVGGRISGTVREDLETLIRHAGSSSRVVSVPALPAKAVLAALEALRLSPLQRWHRLSADRDIVFDCTRAGEMLGWAPTSSGAETLARSYDWYRAGGMERPEGVTNRTMWRERSLGILRRLS